MVARCNQDVQAVQHTCHLEYRCLQGSDNGTVVIHHLPEITAGVGIELLSELKAAGVEKASFQVSGEKCGNVGL